jgi:uncharacterized protein YuzE
VKLSYDPSQNIAYFALRSAEGMEIETVSVSDSVNVDLAPDGTVCGIELLDANAQLGGMEGGGLVLEVAGRRVEVSLAEPA